MKKVIHRDIKPENLLVNAKVSIDSMHVGFGTSVRTCGYYVTCDPWFDVILLMMIGDPLFCLHYTNSTGSFFIYVQYVISMHITYVIIPMVTRI